LTSSYGGKQAVVGVATFEIEFCFLKAQKKTFKALIFKALELLATFEALACAK
jgi:hypothetical protein